MLLLSAMIFPRCLEPVAVLVLRMSPDGPRASLGVILRGR